MSLSQRDVEEIARRVAEQSTPSLDQSRREMSNNLRDGFRQQRRDREAGILERFAGPAKNEPTALPPQRGDTVQPRTERLGAGLTIANVGTEVVTLSDGRSVPLADLTATLPGRWSTS